MKTKWKKCTQRHNFIYDNHLANSSIESWVEKKGFSFIKFPAKSLNLNLIEHLWAALNESVCSDAP